MADNSEHLENSMTEVASVSEEFAASSQEVAATGEEQLAATEEVSSSAERLAKIAEDLEMNLDRFELWSIVSASKNKIIDKKPVSEIYWQVFAILFIILLCYNGGIIN